jgi:hypothetical protein
MRRIFVVLGLAFVLAAPASADLPPTNSGCGEAGSTKTDVRPNVTFGQSMTLRYTRRARLVLTNANQTAAATVRVVQAGGRRVGGTPAGGYTCISDDQTRSAVAIPINEYGRRLVKRNGRLRVTVTFRIVNGSGVTNTVRGTAVIRPER